jgi:hypothetical protein
MVSSASPTSQTRVEGIDLAGALERMRIDGLGLLGAPPVLSTWLRLEGFRFGGKDAALPHALRQAATQLLAIVSQIDAPVGFCLDAREKEVRVLYGGVSGPDELGRMLGASLPGTAELEPARPPTPAFPACAILVGIPSFPGGRQQNTGIDSLIHAMSGLAWRLSAVAFRPPDDWTSMRLLDLAAERREIVNRYLRRGTVEEANNALAEEYVRQLDAALALCKAGSLVAVQATVEAASPAHLRILRGALAAALGRQPILPHPFRVIETVVAVAGLSATVMKPSQAAPLFSPPGREQPGFAIVTRPSLGRAVRASRRDEPSVEIAPISLEGRAGAWFGLPLDELARHVLIAGTTGSGKTTTAQFLLEQVWSERKVPFLVIEPSVKSEYRALLTHPEFRALRVFTAGVENEAPLRLSLFVPERGTAVQTHIDYLRMLFRSCFAGLYPPMPAVLDQALQEVYADRGWLLAANRNPRGASRRAFPSLAQLLEKIDEIVAGSGWEEAVKMNIRSGLRARLGALRVGAKRLLFESVEDVSFAELAAAPTVIELGAIADAEEKALVMGLLMIRLLEHCSRRPLRPGLRHLTLIEEAHQILRQVSESTSVETPNTRAQAVEQFSQLLAEVRAFGEGLVIVEQSPSKLARDAVRNTNLKVAHRLTSADDREVMAGAMADGEAVKNILGVLEPGEAVVFGGLAHRSVEVKVPLGVSVRRTSDAVAVPAAMASFFAERPALSLVMEGCELCPGRASCEEIRTAAAPALAEIGVRRAFQGLFLSLARGCAIGAAKAVFEEAVARAMAPAPATAAVRFCAFQHLIEEAVEEYGRWFRWKYADVREMIATALGWYCAAGSGTDAESATAAWGESLCALTKVEAGPALACSLCRERCTYGPIGRQILRAGFAERALGVVQASARRDPVVELQRYASQEAEATMGTQNPGLALCLSAQVSHERPLTRQEREIARRLAEIRTNGEAKTP